MVPVTSGKTKDKIEDRCQDEFPSKRIARHTMFAPLCGRKLTLFR